MNLEGYYKEIDEFIADVKDTLDTAKYLYVGTTCRTIEKQMSLHLKAKQPKQMSKNWQYYTASVTPKIIIANQYPLEVYRELIFHIEQYFLNKIISICKERCLNYKPNRAPISRTRSKDFNVNYGEEYSLYLSYCME
jgi:hypothetical protein